MRKAMASASSYLLSIFFLGVFAMALEEVHGWGSKHVNGVDPTSSRYFFCTGNAGTAIAVRYSLLQRVAYWPAWPPTHSKLSE